METVTLKAQDIQELLKALTGPGHYIREIQATMSLPGGNCLTRLIEEYNSQVRAYEQSLQNAPGEPGKLSCSYPVIRLRTSTLVPGALDWAIARIQGITNEFGEYSDEFFDNLPPGSDGALWSENQVMGGELIDQEGISIRCIRVADHENPDPDKREAIWAASYPDESGKLFEYRGPSRLIAATRCYVAKRMGDEIEVHARYAEDKAYVDQINTRQPKP